MNIGTRPTLHNGNDTTVEAFLNNFNGNLYGRDMSLEFAARLRSEKHFDSLEELKQQIACDNESAKKILKNIL